MKAWRTKFLVAAMAASSATAWGYNYGGIYFFGDSLTDAGAFTNLVGPAANKFTTNPGTVWAQNLGDRYGLAVTPGYSLSLATTQFTPTGGNDYAVGGARNASTPGVFSLTGANQALGAAIAANIPPVSSQVSTNLGQTTGIADPRALYAFWSGANDVFYQAGVVGAMGVGALQQAGTAVAIAAGDEVKQIGILRAAGARNILVIALPDMGATPYGQSDPANTGLLLTQFSYVYNNALVQALTSAGITQIAYLDPRPLLADIMARPAAWGITNISIPACGAASSLGCGPAQQIPGSSNYLFADGVHPSAFTHRIISDWVYSSLEAPAAVTALGPLAVDAMEGQWRALDDRFRQTAVDDRAPGMQVFVTGDYASGDRLSTSGDGKTLTVGLENRWGAVTGGLAIGVTDANADRSGDGVNIDYTATTLSAFAGQRVGAGHVNAVLSGTSLTFNTHRTFDALSNPGRTSATLWSAKIGGGYDFRSGNLTHGPVVDLMISKADIDAFDEAGVSSLSYASQSRDSLRHRIGWQAVWKLATNWGVVSPYARLTHEKEHKAIDNTVATGLAGTPFSFTVPYGGNTDGYGLLAVGATMGFQKALAHVGVTSTVDRSGGNQQSLALGVTIPF
jgi:outer membrane lipase/esterase